MHDPTLVFFFVSLLVSPSMIAAITGVGPAFRAKAAPGPSGRTDRGYWQARHFDSSTLPLRGTRGLSGRE